MVTEWNKLMEEKQLPHSISFSIVNTLEQQSTVRAWNIAGLPNDSFSIENAILFK